MCNSGLLGFGSLWLSYFGLRRVWKWLGEEVSLATNHCLWRSLLWSSIYVCGGISQDQAWVTGVLTVTWGQARSSTAGSLSSANGTLALSLFSSLTGRKQSSSGWLAVVLVCIFIVGFPRWTAPPSGTAMSCLEPNVTDGEKYTRQKTLGVNGRECGLSVFTTASETGADCCWSRADVQTALTRWVSRRPQRAGVVLRMQRQHRCDNDKANLTPGTGGASTEGAYGQGWVINTR